VKSVVFNPVCSVGMVIALNDCMKTMQIAQILTEKSGKAKSKSGSNALLKQKNGKKTPLFSQFIDAMQSKKKIEAVESLDSESKKVKGAKKAEKGKIFHKNSSIGVFFVKMPKEVSILKTKTSKTEQSVFSDKILSKDLETKVLQHPKESAKQIVFKANHKTVKLDLPNKLNFDTERKVSAARLHDRQNRKITKDMTRVSKTLKYAYEDIALKHTESNYGISSGKQKAKVTNLKTKLSSNSRPKLFDVQNKPKGKRINAFFAKADPKEIALKTEKVPVNANGASKIKKPKVDKVISFKILSKDESEAVLEKLKISNKKRSGVISQKTIVGKTESHKNGIKYSSKIAFKNVHENSSSVKLSVENNHTNVAVRSDVNSVKTERSGFSRSSEEFHNYSLNGSANMDRKLKLSAAGSGLPSKINNRSDKTHKRMTKAEASSKIDSTVSSLSASPKSAKSSSIQKTEVEKNLYVKQVNNKHASPIEATKKTQADDFMILSNDIGKIDNLIGINNLNHNLPSSAAFNANIKAQLSDSLSFSMKFYPQTPTLSVNLYPPSLGRVFLKLSMSSRGLVLRLNAVNASTTNLIKSMVGDLKNHLSKNSISIAKIMVSTLPAASSESAHSMTNNNGNFSNWNNDNNQNMANTDNAGAGSGSEQFGQNGKNQHFRRNEYYRNAINLWI